ncbi:MAG: retron St85 family RNA-directed DNA polymerase [Candidatus Bathyarchaeia archaeon]|nr:retron St85 family RNA-directed DNA polymerase [Candidatus Bathyarchaeia archaeon]
MRIEDAVVEDLNVPDTLIKEAVDLARVRVKKFAIPKKSGGHREIYHPSKKLKVVQYWIMRKVLAEMPVHDAAMAYREGTSILHNAEAHADNRFFLKMDLKDFFPSIRFQDFLPYLEQWHSSTGPTWALDDNSKEFINKACFYKQERLAIGYPSSPLISNIVMHEFDTRIIGEIASGNYGAVVYTRYADDMVFSTNQAGACREIYKAVERVIKSNKAPRLKINTDKTRFGSSTGGTASVTGLRVCTDGHITINRKLKDHVRLMLSLFKKGKLPADEVPSLAGHLAYCHHVAPQFYSGLSKKYFKEIHRIRAKDL